MPMIIGSCSLPCVVSIDLATYLKILISIIFAVPDNSVLDLPSGDQSGWQWLAY